jgi:putative nucleotidyltransferase with HDIG domain
MLAKARNLPPISRAGLELGKLLTSPDTSNEDVVAVLRQDSVLTAKVLRLCNSPILGLSEPVGSVDHAVFILGYNQIAEMIAALAFRGPLTLPLPAYALANDDLWRHSLWAGTAAEILLGEGLGFQADSSLAFTIGLLHDIGKVVTNEFLTRESALAIRTGVAEGCSLVEAERRVLGTDHAEVGAALLCVWRLPELMLEAVALHHRPVLHPEARLSALACFADDLAHRAARIEPTPAAPAASATARAPSVLDYGPERLEPLLARVREASGVATEFMAMPA